MNRAFIKGHGMAKSYVYSPGVHQHPHSCHCECCNHNKINEINEINWNLDYNGEHGQMDVDVQNNDHLQHHHIEFDDDDLEELLNIPTFNMPLETRLKYDFPFPASSPMNKERKYIHLRPNPKRRRTLKFRTLRMPLRVKKQHHRKHVSHKKHRIQRQRHHIPSTTPSSKKHHTSSIRRRLMTPRPKTYRVHLTSK